MQILPSLNSTAQSATNGNPLFGDGGLFGQVAAQGAGLFGALMGLFGQNQGASTGLAAATSGTGAPILAGPLTLQTQISGDGQALPDASALLALLQQALGGAQISPELKTILGDGNTDLADIKARLQELSEDQRDSVMAELASLLQPLLPQVPQHQLIAADTSELKIELDTAKPQLTTPLGGNQLDAGAKLPATPLEAAVDMPEQPNGTAPLTSDKQATKPATAEANSVGTSAERKPSVATPLAETTEQVKSVAPQSAVSNLAAAAAAQEPNKAEKAEKISEKTLDKAPVTPATGPVTGTQSATATNGQTSKVKTTPSAEPVTQAQSLTKPDEKQKAAPDAEQAIAGTDASKTDKASFASHLENLKLNRTGAHTPVSDQIAVHLSRAAQNGQDKMTIRLQPPELGRIDIKLDISGDGMIKASIQVDQPATLDLMLRDQKGLEKALGDAGLKTDGGSLSFNLRGDGLPQRQNGGEQPQGQGSNGSEAGSFNLNGEETEALPAGVMEMTWFIGPDRVDVRI